MEPLSQEQGYRLELARSTANDAIRAVALQRDRINDHEEDTQFAHAGFRQETDVAFLLVALRWLREACQLIAELPVYDWGAAWARVQGRMVAALQLCAKSSRPSDSVSYMSSR